MTSRWLWLLSRIARRIWFRATLFCILAIVTALIAIVISPLIPANLSTQIGADTVDNIIEIIASSMLTVTTFSLSIMVSAYSAATSNVTPRATKLVMEDTTTQNVLATFIGSFLFSLVGFIALSTGAYGENGRVVLFIVTLGVIVLIVLTLLRWIDHLSGLGRVTETNARVEKVAIDAMRERRQQPYLGGNRLSDIKDMPASAKPTFMNKIGYVQHLDMAALSAVARDADVHIYLDSLPGKLVNPTTPIVWIDGAADLAPIAKEAVKCFSVEDTRSFDQDPRLGASVLAEIASRTLSPAINDPGTAMDVITRALRVLAVWREPISEEKSRDVLYPEIHVQSIDLADLFDDLFTPMARDCASIVEIGLKLQKAFAVLASFNQDRYRENAIRHSTECFGACRPWTQSGK